MKLKETYLKRMKVLLKEEYEKYIVSLKEEPVKGIFIDEKKMEKEKFLTFFQTVQPISYTKNGFYIQEKIGNHPFHHGGCIYSQEPSAMIVTNSISIEKDDFILDVCASPGGKSISSALFLGENGFLFSNEINKNRVKILLSNLERFGIQNSICANLDSKTLARLYPNTFSKVFVDAPCSGEGMFRKDEVASKNWNENLVKSCAKTSLEILKNASLCVKNNGYLIYSTCTFSYEENEAVIKEFLKENTFTLEEVPEKIKEITMPGIDLEKCRRFYPYKAKGEGQFVAILKKKKEEMRKPDFKTTLKPISKTQEKIVQEFLTTTLTCWKNPIYLYHDNIITLPFLPFPIPDKNILSVGVKMGEIQNNRFIPHHQFFKAYASLFKNKVDLSLKDKRVEEYLQGLEIEADASLKGYGVLFVEGIALGGFKASNGKLKNYYPKGLRKK